MMTKFKTIAAAAVFASFGVASQAATFDFESQYEGSWDAITGGSWTDDGITVSASALVNKRADDAIAYLDGPSGGLPAGLGVCSTGLDAGGECVQASDDNLSGHPLYESLILTFKNAVRIVDIVLRDSKHNLFSTNTIYVATNGDWNSGQFWTYGTDSTMDLAAGTSFLFETKWDDRSSAPFYISSMTVAPIPLPAGGVLLLTALGGLAAVRRRKAA